MVEYGLILALIAIVVIGALQLVGEQTESVFDKISKNCQPATAAAAAADFAVAQTLRDLNPTSTIVGF